jgi:two-component system, sensor histidine kinase
MNASSLRSANRTRRSLLLWLTGAVIAVALALVVWTQVQQFRMLSLASQHQDDYVQIGQGQLESEYLRLRQLWAEALGAGAPDWQALQLRYDIFVSRVTLLDTERSHEVLLTQKETAQAYRQIKAFVAAADAILGTAAPPNPDVAALAALYPQLETLDRPVRAMFLEGSHHLSTLIAQRNAAVLEANRKTLALTILLALAAFGFAVLSLSQFRRLDLRRRSLEIVTEELRQARRVAEDASAAKSNFLANMSHEIRTPLQGVLGMLALLADSPLDRRQQERLRTARDSADHLLAILNDILDLAKLEAGKLATAPQRVDLHRLLVDLEALMRAQAMAKDLTLKVVLPPGLPQWTELDPTRVRQILLNLCSNAIKFTAQGRVTVTARAVDRRLQIAVEDTGIGIDATTLEQLFQRFGRGDDTRARRHGGTGLGLEISRQLARRMGGDITVTSTPGQGSRFVVDLPLIELPAPAPVQAAPAPASDTMAAAAPGRLVLVADDNAVNRDYTGAVLEHLGHRVVFAHDGAQAVTAVRQHAVDMVLMDLHMPEVDGMDATRMIRQLDGTRAQVPIVALTADAFADTRAACLAAGMNDFVAKPVSPSELAALLTRFGSPATPLAPTLADPLSQTDSSARDALLDQRILGDIFQALPAGKLALIADRFVTEARDSVDRMHAALGSGDREALHRCAHSCKGMAASLGLKALANAAAQIQQSAAASDTAVLGDALRSLEALIGPSRQALSESVQESAGR